MWWHVYAILLLFPSLLLSAAAPFITKRLFNYRFRFSVMLQTEIVEPWTGTVRTGTGWLLAHADNLFIVTTAHTFNYTVQSGQRMHIFCGAPSAYDAIQTIVTLKNESVTKLERNEAMVVFMRENQKKGIRSDIAIVVLSQHDYLRTYCTPVRLRQLATDKQRMAIASRVQMFGFTSAAPTLQGDSYMVTKPSDCLTNANEKTAFCFRSRSNTSYPVHGNSGAAVLCPPPPTRTRHDATSAYICGMVYAGTNTRVGIALHMAYFVQFITDTVHFYSRLSL